MTDYSPGVGWWRPNTTSGPGAQLVYGVEHGPGSFIDGTLAGYAAPLKAVYKIQICPYDVASTSNADSDQSGGLVSAQKILANPSWIAKNPTGLTNLHDFYDPGGGVSRGLFPNLGNVGFQAAAAQNAIDFITRNGPCAFYLDNVLGYVYDPGDGGSTGTPLYERVYPNGYSSNRDWRQNAVLPFIQYFCGAVRAAYPSTYIIMSLSDIADTVEGETRTGPNWSQDTGASRVRFWTEVAALTSKPDAVFWEYFLQIPDDPTTSRAGDPYSNEEDATFHRWTTNQACIASAHSLGFDFHGHNWHNHAFSGTANIGRFVRASMMLDQTMTRRDMYWIANDPNDGTAALTDSDIYSNPGGAATGSKTTTGTLQWRAYPNYTVIVNPTRSNDTQTIAGAPRLVTALNSMFVATVAATPDFTEAYDGSAPIIGTPSTVALVGAGGLSMDTTNKHRGASSLRIDASAGTSFVDYQLPTTQDRVYRLYIRFPSDFTTDPDHVIINCVKSTGGDGYAQLFVDCSSGSPKLKWRMATDSTATGYTSIATLTTVDWYRLEWRWNTSANPWTFTWGYAAGERDLITMDTAFTGSNTNAAISQAFFIPGALSESLANLKFNIDDISSAPAGSAYPLGATGTALTGAADFELAFAPTVAAGVTAVGAVSFQLAFDQATISASIVGEPPSPFVASGAPAALALLLHPSSDILQKKG